MIAENPFKKNRAFAIGLVFTVAEGLLAGMSYISIYFVIDMLQNQNVSINQILKITAFLLTIFLLRIIIYGIGYTNGQIGGAAVSKNIRLFLGNKFKKIPLSRFTQGQVGQYVNTMTSDVSSYETILTHKTSNLAKNITLCLLLMSFVSLTYLPAGLILLLSLLLLIPELWLSFRIVKKYGVGKNTISAEAVSSIVEYVTGIQTFRAYGLGGAKNKSTTTAMKAFSDVCYQYEAHGIPLNFSFSILRWLTIPLIMGVAAPSWMTGAINSVDYLMLCMLPMLMAKLTASISIDLFSYKNLMISKNNILRVVEEPEEQGNDAAFAPEVYDITFNNVDFSYVTEETVLNGVSFHANNEQLTAIVGDSGSGKSTILNLIAKYYEPGSGSIEIGSQPIEHVMADQVLNKVAIVDQDVFLFNDTVRANIRYARPTATDTEIEAACRAANCHSFIEKMEHGYDTRIGENGNLLSGGERQRLSIARAILKDSPILLLDEATASLDIENELAVKQAIANLLSKKKTVIMIAHTLSIVKNADLILVVADGQITEMGSHDELLGIGGKYAAMWGAEQRLSE